MKLYTQLMMNQSQAPGAPSGAGKAIIHARMNIGDTVLIANDVPPSVFQKIRSVYIYLSVDSPEQAERVHNLLADGGEVYMPIDRKSTRLNSSHLVISYAVFCLKKKNKTYTIVANMYNTK